MAKQPATPKKQKSFEQTLWDTADKLRGSVESSEYKHVVLSLIFLKFVSDKFEERKAELIAEGKEAYLDMVDFYTMKNVFYLPEESRWSFIQKHAKQDDIAVKIDTALHTVEKNNKALRGALPDNYFSRLDIDVSKLAALIDSINNIDTVGDKEEDVVGRVYEYFLGKFAATEGKGGGEFYTPKCVVNLIAEMIEPYKGKIYDPCCGSGGMFVQSVRFVESHQGNKKDVSIYGQELTATTYKLAKMNLAIRGIAGNLGEVPADTFFKDQHQDLKADFIMANPPFNLKEWRAADELTHDPRWAGYEVPPTGNANYGWILHMISKLSQNGVAGFVLANGSMSTNTSGEGAIRQKIIENDLVDCMIALPGQLFYTTQIPVCLWFLTKNKKAQVIEGHTDSNHRDRKGETLFIDARNLGTMVDRTHKELTAADIAEIARTYHAWRGVPAPDFDSDSVGADLRACPGLSVWADLRVCPDKQGEHIGSPLRELNANAYADVAGFCKSATLEEIRANDYVLTPGRYVGAAEIEDDGIPFEKKMTDLTQTLYRQMEESEKLDAVIRKNLEVLGYGR
ncbi:type I restriction-modification system subunit M [Desulfuromonas thiophila]|uniref:type I restriction-modification system subunit M n=1 Tax=Desulfuromonas thiophila TaxID=57664 RepID=UPI0024A9D383|nr:class I SAM-dependent DNA methyltransferase [Desulfuromonas thiophila]